MATIPEGFRELLGAPVVVSLATILPNGQPQVTPVWCDLEGDLIRVNTVVGRQKYKNMVERPQVAVMGVDPKNPYRYIEVRGRVVRFVEEGGAEHIDKLAREYLGTERYPWHNPKDTRVICYIEPVKVLTMG
jgi:PPOX class probable F420-dependent enzyme